MTRESLKKKVLGTLLAVVPALVTGFVSYCQAQQNTEAIEKKAEAGYQITRSAYVELVRDVESNKTTIEILQEFCLSPDLFVSAESTGFGEGHGSFSMEEAEEDEGEVPEVEAELPKAPNPAAEERLDRRPKSNEWPKNLDQAQQALMD